MRDGIIQTLLAPVYDVAKQSPLDKASKLSAQLGSEVYLKREDLQSVHSFKLRGAYNKIAQLSRAEQQKGVITASAGNHAQGVALAANKLGLSALIVMPRTTPQIKVDAVASWGAEIELVGDSYSDAAGYAHKIIEKTGRTFIHPFDDPMVIAGQGTIGREIVEQLANVTHIFVPVGGGGLLAGIAQYVKAIRPEVRIIAVEPEDSCVMHDSLRAGKRVMLPHVGVFADGVAVRQAGKHTFAIAQQYVDESITVTTDEMCAAIKSIFEDTRSIVEPAGALGVAGMVAYAREHDVSHAVMVAINSGANMTFERLQYISERTLIGSGKEAVYSVELAEKPGSLQYFCEHVVNGHNITQFGYRLNSRDKATALVGIGVSGDEGRQAFSSKMREHGYKHQDLTDENIAKDHVRHMIGGSAAMANNEHFYRILFPERPNALSDFLSAVSSQWNISLFHYRGQGADAGSVLIGFEVKDKSTLEKALQETGYQWSVIDGSASIESFIASVKL